MDITSVLFFAFVAVCLLIYWNLPGKYQWILLLISSLVFYCVSAKIYTIIYLCFSVVSVYLATKYFDKVNNSDDNENNHKKLVLVLVVICNIAILVLLKYTNLGINTFNYIFGTKILNVNWLAPLAISFYTLQIVSYLLDNYWGVAKTEKNILKLFLFTSYFPQMVSGPISRYSQIGEQLVSEHRFDYDRVTNGIKRIALGLIKKMAISNRLAIVVDEMYASTELHSGVYGIVAAVLFVLELYTDFSGCMDIVLGVSECFGISLPENFRAPFFSKTVQEFWRRWHITLGQWLRDYIMNPILKSKSMISLGRVTKKRLGKKQGKKIPVYISMLVLWLVMGLWHGSSWKYIIGEGLWFWAVIVLGHILESPFNSIKKCLRIKENNIVWKSFQVVRTVIIFAIGNIFFHAVSLSESITRVRELFNINISLFSIKQFLWLFLNDSLGGRFGLIILMIALLIMVIIDYNIYQDKKPILLLQKHNIAKWVVYFAFVGIIILSLNIGGQEFAYAQF